jgi:hypothetical protein
MWAITPASIPPKGEEMESEDVDFRGIEGFKYHMASLFVF